MDPSSRHEKFTTANLRNGHCPVDVECRRSCQQSECDIDEMNATTWTRGLTGPGRRSPTSARACSGTSIFGTQKWRCGSRWAIERSAEKRVSRTRHGRRKSSAGAPTSKEDEDAASSHLHLSASTAAERRNFMDEKCK